MNRVGIDLGTTNSAIAWNDGAKSEIIEVFGRRTTPSVVAYDKFGNPTVGQKALDQAPQNDRFTFQRVKRLMGLRYVATEDVSQQITGGADGGLELRGPQGNLKPQEIVGEIVQVLLAAAEQKIGKIDSAVITIPAYFGEPERQATMQAGYLAGLKQIELLTEPVAAALQYQLDRQEFARVLVYDLGGGTFDVSVLNITAGRDEVIGKNGSTRLGGVNFDDLIVDELCNLFEADHGIDLRKKTWCMVRVRQAAEEAKIKLSADPTARVFLTDLVVLEDKPDGTHLSMDYTLTVERLEELTRHLVDQTIEITKRALADAKRPVDQIDKVIMVGGMTKMPAIRRAVTALMGKDPGELVNPDEVVALGAAAHAAALDYRLAQSTHGDATALAFGFEAFGGTFHAAIPKGTPFPCTREVLITSARDDQVELEVKVFEGSWHEVSQNTLIAAEIIEVDPVQAGAAEVRLRFDVDVNGMLIVIAMNEAGEQLVLHDGPGAAARI